MSNRYRRAIKSLRSGNNKRRNLREELPTNNTTGLYMIEPDNLEYVDVPLVNFDQDDSGTDTTGLFDSDGTILTIEPPDELGDHSFILGPMVSQYYAYAAPNTWTLIGYVNQSNRRAVTLGRIAGRIENWDGESDFTSYGQLTIEQARWFRDTYKIDDYYIFYPGPPVGPPDEFGRYKCRITGTPKRGRTPGDYGDQDRAGYPWGPLFGPKGPLGDFFKKLFGPKGPFKGLGDLGSEVMRQLQGLNDGLLTLEKVQDTIRDAKNNGDVIPSSDPNGRPEIRPGAKGSPENPIDMPLSKSTIGDVIKNVYQGMDLEELKGTIQTNTSKGIFSGGNIGAKGTYNNLAKDPYFDKNGDLIIPDTYGFDPGGDIAEKPFMFGHTVGDFAKSTSGAILGSGGEFEAQRQELEKDILTQFDKTTAGIILGAPGRKEPIVHMVKRIPKSQLPKTAVEAAAKKSVREEIDTCGKNLLTESRRKRILKDIKKPYVAPEQPTKIKVKPTGRKNRVVGADLMNNVEVPASFKPQPKLWRKKDYQANVRASQEKKNEILELVGSSDHYWEYLTETKRKKALEERNIKMAEEFEKQMWVLYEQEMNKQNKLDKLASSIKKSKDIAPEYPKNPPPEMVNGWHPEYGNRGNYYNNLDPQSAEAMPSTGNPEIDDKVRKARKIKKILGKKA